MFSEAKICCKVSILSKDMILFMHFFSFLYIFFFSVAAASDLKIRSIIVLDNNVPSECGLSFETTDIVSKVTIKKNRNGTSTVFNVQSKKEILKSANIITNSVNLNKLLDGKFIESKNILIESVTNENETSSFFQELLIGGAEMIINDKNIDIMGPIDSKVRLEYLFCTGEMFLPNYN